ncbi:MAG: hypothetical protein JWN67_3383 [Actinomycetia bacterium]|nr:hypothetical protein [Actinomycetes bacterium]
MFEQRRLRLDSRRHLDSFHLADGHLVLGWQTHRWPDVRLLRFDPEGIWSIGEQDTLRLAWDRYVDEAARPGSWSLEPSRLPRSPILRVVVWQRQRDGRATATLADAHSRLTPLALPLAHFLGTMPDLRPQLGDPSRLERLLDDIAAFVWYPRPPVRLPFRTRTYDAISGELDRRLHRYAQRAIAGEPMFRLDDVVTGVRARGADDDGLEAKIRRHVEVMPWPFGALRP